MSFGGIGNLLTSVLGTAASPAIETLTHNLVNEGLMDSEIFKKLVEDEATRGTLSNIAGGTLGTALTTGLGAGMGYLTGGEEGAAAGAIQNMIMGGGAALQHDKFKEAMGLTGAGTTKPHPGSAMASTFDTSTDPASITSPDAWSKQAQSAYPTPYESATSGLFDAGVGTDAAQGMETMADEAATSATSGAKKPSYFEMTGQLAMPAWTLGMGYGGSMLDSNRRKKREEEEALRQAKQEQDLKNLMSSMYGYAEGGGVEVSSDFGVPTTVVFPDWFVEDFAHAGGIGGYATGGYINLQPMDPDTSYPQSMIPKAQPYPGGAPIRNEVVDFERGGLLNGAGNGMSDDIPATIDGREPVRVADGEYVVPSEIANSLGEDRLLAMLDKVRASAHAKKGKQIIEDAGKRAFIQTMSGVKA